MTAADASHHARISKITSGTAHAMRIGPKPAIVLPIRPITRNPSCGFCYLGIPNIQWKFQLDPSSRCGDHSTDSADNSELSARAQIAWFINHWYTKHSVQISARSVQPFRRSWWRRKERRRNKSPLKAYNLPAVSASRHSSRFNKLVTPRWV